MAKKKKKTSIKKTSKKKSTEKKKASKKKSTEKKKTSKKKKSDNTSKQAETNVGMVGHVDHGKTTLVEALSGEWTDRYAEEMRKGISIKLGYANCTIVYCPKCDKYSTYFLANKLKKKRQQRNTCPYCAGVLIEKRKISFVDAPGHEILMATMLSGASLMDGACLLISANEKCPQPQTREHLAALGISNIKKIIILQNKIDAVSREVVIENYKEIKEFIKGTVAENAPIIPISAIYKINLEKFIRTIEETIPTPEFDEKETPRFHIARSFDINKPGTPIEELRGGVIGGSISQGTIKVGDKLEILPGFRRETDYIPLLTTVKSLYQSNTPLEIAKPGGLIAIGTNLDPALTKADNLIGNLAGLHDEMPDVQFECNIQTTLLEKVLGAEEELEIEPLKIGEPLLLVAGTSLTAGIVQKIGKKNTVTFKLKRPICVQKDSTVAISRMIRRRYRLIGYGTLKS
ncbi:MAG: translation initiation factor IF-2 subunit gamma [Promethearchaeota archaeon]